MGEEEISDEVRTLAKRLLDNGMASSEAIAIEKAKDIMKASEIVKKADSKEDIVSEDYAKR